MKLSDINIRDPFILPVNGKYYMYGSRGMHGRGFDVYTADTLDGEWSAPKPVFLSAEHGINRDTNWAPEVHFYNGKYYMFATFEQDSGFRGTYILSCDTPDGKFVPHSDGAITPRDWHSLDGTLYVSPDGTPYMVFCHEWVQINFGTIEAVRLSDDFKHPVGEPFTVIESRRSHWVKPQDTQVVTDGPYFYRAGDGRLLMIWSSFSGGYITAVEESDNGDITGKFTQYDGFLFESDGGHGMIFRDLEGCLRLTLHTPNSNSLERPAIFALREDGACGLALGDKI